MRVLSGKSLRLEVVPGWRREGDARQVVYFRFLHKGLPTGGIMFAVQPGTAEEIARLISNAARDAQGLEREGVEGVAP